MQEDFQNQMWNFMQNFHDGLLIPPPGEEKEPEAITDTELLSTKDIHPLAVQEPPRESDICQLIEECCVEASKEQKQKMEDTILEIVKICQEKEFLCIHDDEEIDVVTSSDDVLPLSVKNDDDYDLLLGEEDLFLSNNAIPPGIKNVVDDPERDIRFLEELLIDNSILSQESFDSNFEEYSSIPRPLLEPPDVESFFDLKPDVIAKEISDKLNEDKCFDPGREINVSTKIKDDDYFPFIDDESLSNEDVSMEIFKIYSNPLFDDVEIISNKIDPHYFNAESNLIESLPNRDTLFDSSPKLDYLEEFFGELMPTSIINKERIRREHEEYISLMEKLLSINSFPRPLENFHANTIIETFLTSPIPIEDSDSLREEIDIFTSMNDLMPPAIKSDDYDSKGDIHFLEELLKNDTFPLPENKSSNFDHHDDTSFPRPPLEPPGVEIFFEPDSCVLTTKVVKGISKDYVLMPNIFPTLPTFDHVYPVYDTLLPFSSENKDKVFKPDVEVFFDFEPDTGVLTTKVVRGISEHYILMPNILPTLPTLDLDLDFTPSHNSLGSESKIFDLRIFIEV
nr:hypothetical protein [Tanacetum cinerariifolium]